MQFPIYVWIDKLWGFQNHWDLSIDGIVHYATVAMATKSDLRLKHFQLADWRWPNVGVTLAQRHSANIGLSYVVTGGSTLETLAQPWLNVTPTLSNV